MGRDATPPLRRRIVIRARRPSPSLLGPRRPLHLFLTGVPLGPSDVWKRDPRLPSPGGAGIKALAAVTGEARAQTAHGSVERTQVRRGGRCRRTRDQARVPGRGVAGRRARRRQRAGPPPRAPQAPGAAGTRRSPTTPGRVRGRRPPRAPRSEEVEGQAERVARCSRPAPRPPGAHPLTPRCAAPCADGQARAATLHCGPMRADGRVAYQAVPSTSRVLRAPLGSTRTAGTS